MEIRVLQPGDDRAGFVSDDEVADRFLHRFAALNEFRRHIGVTCVAVEGERILAFTTVAARRIEIEELPGRLRHKLRYYPLPVIGIARLVVDRTARDTGLDAALLRFVLALAMKVAAGTGCSGVVVDAAPGAVEFYTRYGFVPFEALEGVAASRPRPIPMWLPMTAVEKAMSEPAGATGA